MAAVSCLLLAPRADAQSPPSAGSEKPVHAFGEDHPSCLEWTDGCLVCSRRDGSGEGDEGVACSMVGAACLPAAVVCLKGR